MNRFLMNRFLLVRQLVCLAELNTLQQAPDMTLLPSSPLSLQAFILMTKARQKRLSKAGETALQMLFFACKKIHGHLLEKASMKKISHRASH